MNSKKMTLKKAACAVLSLFVLSLAGMTQLKAQTLFTIGDLYYYINPDGATATLAGTIHGTEVSGELSIPDSIRYEGHDYPVTRIGSNAFISCGGLTGHLVIPNTVTFIGENAFLACSGLTQLTLGNALDTIGPASFYGCKGLTGSLTIPNSVRTLQMAAFYGCNKLTGTLTLSNSLARIEPVAFYKCSGFSGLVLGEALRSIGTSAFFGCTGLTGTLTLPKSLQDIEGRAFCNCSGLTEVVSLAFEPPAFVYEGVFEGTTCTKLTVPCGCIPAYQNSDWSRYFSTILEDCSDVAELDALQVAVYPNPTSGALKIEAEGLESVEIYNLFGEKLYENTARNGRFDYDLSPFGSGVYVVRVQTKGSVVTKQIVVK